MLITLIIIGILLIILILFSVYSVRKLKNTPAEPDSDKIKKLNLHNFNSQIKSGVILVDFWSEWCMPCKMMIPILNSLAKDLPENASIGKLDIEQNREIAAKYKVRSIPTTILFKNGKEINRFVGVKQKDFFLKEIKKVL